MQRGGEAALQALGQAVHVGQPPPLGDARQEGRDAVDVGGHRFEDQVAQPDQDRQSAATAAAPNTAPAASPATMTVGVPRPRRLMMPMSKPM